MSSRAASRLETLGFGEVFYYKPGKADWLACGLPVEKEQAGALTVLDRMTKQFPTCRPNDSVSEAKERAEKVGWDLCPVVNEEGIVLGLLGNDAWKNNPDDPVDQVMQPAPTTLRPNYPVDEAIEFLGKQELAAVLITTPEGKLIGILRRARTPSQKQIPKSETWT